MAEKNTLNPDYFEKVYEANDDPWNFQTSEYESKKYAATLAALPKPKYQNALEIGCSIGVLTKLLAKKSENLLATDVSQNALEQAKERCKNFYNITFKLHQFPEELPNQKFDLIVISEVAYYLSQEDWKLAIKNLAEILDSGGQTILVHWLPEVHDYPQTGDEVHEIFKELMQNKMQNIFNKREENYRIDVWEKDEVE